MSYCIEILLLLYQRLSYLPWNVPEDITGKLHGSLDDLQRTFSFIVKSSEEGLFKIRL